MFTRGQKVVCVDASPWYGAPYLTQALVKNRIYTVKDYSASDFEKPSVSIVELAWPPFMHACRFRPLITRKTDIGVFTAMLDPATRPKLIPAD